MCCEKTVTDLLESSTRGLPEVWSFDSGTHNQHVLGENKTAELKQEKSPADGQFHFFLSSQTAHTLILTILKAICLMDGTTCKEKENSPPLKLPE